jgi:hypothetical protein
VRWILPPLAFILACAGGPEATEAQQYVDTMGPVLVENGAMAQEFLTEASRVKKKEVDGGQLAERLAKDFVPRAAELSRSVAAITPVEPRLSATHAVLVKAWSDRATAYSALSAAWAAGDVAAWDQALRQNTQSKLDEERYFGEINGVLAGWDLSLTQYPAAL